MGRNCLRELLRHEPKKVIEVYAVKSALSDAKDIEKLLIENRTQVAVCDRGRLDSLVQSDSHQGFVAKISDRIFESFESVLELPGREPRALVLALDGIQDPQNFGAILRAAECFGVDAVMWSKNRSSPLTPVVSKSSAGASELVPLIQVSNLASSLEKMRDSGFWVVAASVQKGSESLDNFGFPEHTVLVLGAEGEGIQRLIQERAHCRVHIPMHGRIDSLNVSQSAAVMLGAYRRQHGIGAVT